MSDHPHWVNWFEIPCTDIDRAMAFYQDIFNIELQFMDLGELKMAVLPHGNSGGALVQHQSYQPSAQGSLLYLNGGHDLQDVLDRIPDAGGLIIMEKRQISDEHGFMALFLDSEGNRLALHSMG